MSHTIILQSWPPEGNKEGRGEVRSREGMAIPGGEWGNAEGKGKMGEGRRKEVAEGGGREGGSGKGREGPE